MYLHIQKRIFYQKFIKLSQRTVAQPNINAQIYGGLAIYVPLLGLQHQFVDFVNAIEKLKSEMRQGLNKLELLYKSLMHNFFMEDFI